MDGSCSAHRAEEKYIRNFDWKPEGVRPIGTPRHMWEDNIKTECESLD
jgi:hypothetical protein